MIQPTKTLAFGPFISRKQAILQGLKCYFQGKPCKRGHVDLRRVHGGCVSCGIERKRSSGSAYVKPKKQGPVQISYGPFLASKQARNKGLKRFYAGPCFDRGHAAGKKLNGGCIECDNLRARAWAIANPDKSKKASLRYRSSKKASDTRSKWCQNNGERLRAQCSEREKRYRLLKNNRSLSSAISCRIRSVLKGNSKTSTTLQLTGCSSWQDLRACIEERWQPGMSWSNWGRDGWHIDHIRPCASFDLSDPTQQLQCFHYSNLQPLWAKENLSKSDKWEAAPGRVVSLGSRVEVGQRGGHRLTRDHTAYTA